MAQVAASAARYAPPRSVTCPHRDSLRESIRMKLTINGQEQDLAAVTLANLIEHLGMKQDRVAVELNRNIVPRNQWADTNLAEGDHLEIVHFVGGGFS